MLFPLLNLWEEIMFDSKQLEFNFGSIFTFKDAVRKVNRQSNERGSVLLNAVANFETDLEEKEADFQLERAIDSHVEGL